MASKFSIIASQTHEASTHRISQIPDHLKEPQRDNASRGVLAELVYIYINFGQHSSTLSANVRLS